jgi:uncharacterized protein YbaP (TraB family)
VNARSVIREGKPGEGGRRRVRSAAWAALAWLLLSACASAAPPAAEHGRLWRIARTGLPDSYVLGTIHLHDPAVARVPEPVRRAVQRSRVLATELPFEVAFGATSGLAVALATGDFATEMRDDGETLPPGLDLEWMIGGPAFARLSHRLEANGVPDAAVRRMKPWVALLRATREEGAAGAEESLDEKLVATARAARIRVLPLEGIDDQVAAFDALPLLAQVELLRHALMHPESLDESRTRALAAWQRGDLPALADLAARSSARYPETREAYAQLSRHLIVNRTAVMHHRLFLPLMRGGVFAAVGAAHLPGSKGLLALLREDGYRIERVW